VLPVTGKRQAPDPVAAAETAKAALIKAEAAALKALSVLVDKWEKVPGEPIIHVIARMPDREQAAAIELLHLVAPFAPSLQRPE
jgi:hypothetical protein